MDVFVLVLGWLGIYGPIALSMLGSAIGCTRAGKAACGAILEVEGGYGRYIGLSVLPSSIGIYGIVIIGMLQGDCCAAAINASKGKPAIFGLSVTPAAIVEGFAVFAFVFALIVSGTIPKG
jgi:V/A-type H+/Na+-transporting ATPase subunit K